MHTLTEHTDYHTETRVVPIQTANAMRTIAQAYPGMIVDTVATQGHTFFREPPAHEVEDQSISIHVPKGCEAISLRWRSRETPFDRGIPRAFYLAVAQNGSNPIQLTDSR